MEIERVVVVVTHAGHDQRTGRSNCGPQCTDESQRAALNRCELRKGGVNDQDPAGLDAEGAELAAQAHRSLPI